MRKCILMALIALLGGFQLMNAIPARPGKFSVTQPDGSRLVLERHGDEWGHWLTDASGNIVRKDADGFYRIVSEEDASSLRETAARRRTVRRGAQAARRAGQGGVLGQKHFLVILVEFKDLSFKVENPNEAFSNMMNKPGYSVNGGTGSARDFYYDNSHGRFEPIFDVYGPVQLDTTKAYYGGNDWSGNDKNPEKAVAEGCKALDAEIDFSRYDNDGDGKVDLVFMYYAGYGEADSSDSDSIWPHQYELSSAGILLTLDGVTVDSYACSNELVGYGSLAGKLDGIGTACHEFGHAMGLPDFYDTDYETNGEAGALYSFSTMCAGAYNNEGRTPPYFNFEERMLLGWVGEADYQTFDSTGDYTILPVNEDVAYRTFTDMDGEYFVYENRTKTDWDRYLPAWGMVVYHVDKSSRSVRVGWGSSTAHDLWADWRSSNSINENGSHPCFYIVPAGDQSSLNYYQEERIPFPYGTIDNFTPKSWNGEEGNVSFSRIARSGERVTLHANVFTGEVDYPTIADAGSYRSGDRFTFDLVRPEHVEAPASVVWYYDDEPAGAASVTLTAGAHVIDAYLTYADGRKETVTLEIQVQ